MGSGQRKPPTHFWIEGIFERPDSSSRCRNSRPSPQAPLVHYPQSDSSRRSNERDPCGGYKSHRPSPHRCDHDTSRLHTYRKFRPILFTSFVHVRKCRGIPKSTQVRRLRKTLKPFWARGCVRR